MKALRKRRSLVALAVVLGAATALAASAAMQHGGTTSAAQKLAAVQDRTGKLNPDAFSQKGNLGPATYQDQQIAALAYPSHTLSASLLNQERNFFYTHIRGRGHAHGKNWQQIGPTTATQPAVLNAFDGYFASGFDPASASGFVQNPFQVSGRITAMAVNPSCDSDSCMLWIAAAGGGIWRSDNALASDPHWQFVSGSFGTNAIGALTYDAQTHTLYAGTGEPNASGDSEAGVGIYKSTDNGDHWKLLPGSVAAMTARSISSIVVEPGHPNTLYVGTTRGVRGAAGVTGGAVSFAPDAAPWGLWKSTNGGNHFTFVWDGNGSPRGVNHVEMDSHGTLYAAAFQEGIWRSADGGNTWEQVFATQDPTDNAARTEFSLNTTADGHTRIYVGDGTGNGQTAVYRADSIDTTAATSLTDGTTNPGYTVLTSSDMTSPQWGTSDYCEGQCWYDNFVYSPPGYPNDVYVGGSFDYGAWFVYGGRAVLLSQDAGATWTDQSTDAGPTYTGIHPDQHALVTDPANPLLFFEGSDGGVIRSSGEVVDNASTFCGAAAPYVPARYTTACNNLHQAVPTKLTTLNAGLPTLQFQNIAANPSQSGKLIGGTQDNGTWLGTSDTSSWNQTIYGDGGIAAFDATDPNFMLNEFYGPSSDVNFQNGDPSAWVIASAPLAISGEATAFYKPQIGDPVVGGTFFIGGQSVWRTQDYAGSQSALESSCPEFFVYFNTPGCGDFAPLGGTGKGTTSDLTSSNYGTDRTGGYVVSLARASSDSSTLWAATATGRVFISTNANTADAGAVTFTRLDNTSPAAPNRFVSGITVDPTNPNHAWITYSGYNANTPSQPGHVFDVLYNPVTNAATFTDIDHGSGPLGDLPVTGIARDDSTGTLYVATDFTVLASKPKRNGSYTGNWVPAAAGMPEVEVPWITIDQSSHTLYAATHGLGIWSLSLGG